MLERPRVTSFNWCRLARKLPVHNRHSWLTNPHLLLINNPISKDIYFVLGCKTYDCPIFYNESNFSYYFLGTLPVIFNAAQIDLSHNATYMSTAKRKCLYLIPPYLSVNISSVAVRAYLRVKQTVVLYEHIYATDNITLWVHHVKKNDADEVNNNNNERGQLYTCM